MSARHTSARAGKPEQTGDLTRTTGDTTGGRKIATGVFKCVKNINKTRKHKTTGVFQKGTGDLPEFLNKLPFAPVGRPPAWQTYPGVL